VGKAAEFPPGEGRPVTAGNLRLALFNDGGEFLAVDGSCPHQGAALSDGVLHDGRVICPLHSWVFDLRSGECPRNSHDPVACYPVRCKNGLLEVQLPSDDPHRGVS
jgi:nitrite reductase/ring-hydroxylating ferredoxin subunit